MVRGGLCVLAMLLCLAGSAAAADGDWQQVSVFLSVVDVHVNRSPYRGEVVEASYRKGSFLATYRTKSAHRNERSEARLQSRTSTPSMRTRPASTS